VLGASPSISGVLAAASVGASGSSTRGEALAQAKTPASALASAIKSLGEELRIDSPALWHALDRMGQELTDGVEAKAMTIAAVTGLTMSVSYVVWTIRANFLIAALLAGIPLWKQLDPLEVLMQAEAAARKKQDQGVNPVEQKDEQAESLLDLLRRANRRAPRPHWSSRSRTRRRVKNG
jgi:hypothetical protein